MTAFITHPSVRVKGTEHNYSPVLCQDEDCSASSKGLKILRCCNHCDIIGTIKGEKKFRGAHWHCYRCRNGFNRRDEAVKHYKTHFRNPHTTFQIQVTQEVNSRQYYEQSAEAHHKAYGGTQVTSGSAMNIASVSPVIAETVISSSTMALTTENSDNTGQTEKDSKLANGISPAEDTLGSMSTKGHQTLVLMDPDGENGELVYNDNSNLITDQNGDALDQNLLIEKQMLELHQQNQQLRIEKAENEHRLQVEVQQLKNQIAGLMEVNWQMAEELKQYKYSEDIKNKINQMIEHMEMQHKELLHLQLELLQKEYRKLRHQANESPVSSQDSAKDCTNRTAKQALVGTSTFRPRCHSISLTIPSSVVTEQEIRTSEHEIMSSSLDEIGGTEVDLSSRNVISFIEASDNSSNGSADLTTLEIVEVKLDSESPISTIESPSPTHVHLYPVTQVNDHMELSASKRVSEDDSVGECQPKIQRTN
ncbi:myosin heavy chain, non-muscle isoform X2 [Narcine bancroftii]|uniref:myosin heavy chain, non-muscle isoform X2 n=1 Tax=Narcine bancroftii TaxID=1343680 RepID=UPI003831CA8A